MCMYRFKQAGKDDLQALLVDIFDILYSNMNAIAPTGSSYEEDYRIWSASFMELSGDGQNRILLIIRENKLCGYFQYRLTSDTFKMDEIEFRSEYQGSGLFRELFSYLVSTIPANIVYTEAYARKENRKSQDILQHLGLGITGENKAGTSLHYRGAYQTLKELYGK